MIAPSLLQLVLQALVSAVPETLDSLTLAEVLWLAPKLPVKFMESQLPPPLVEGDLIAGQPENDDTRTLAKSLKWQSLGRSASEDTLSSVDQAEIPSQVLNPPATAAASLLPPEALPRDEDVAALRPLLPVWLEDPPLLTDSLALVRSLAPLQAECVDGPILRLDEVATVDAYVASCGPDGRGGCWLPVLVPMAEPRYELVLVIDGALMMALWQRLVLDLQRALASCAVVRHLHLVRLNPDGTVPLRQRSWCQPHPEGRRLLLLLSDCCGDAWWSGAMAEQMIGWGDEHARAVLQVLPSVPSRRYASKVFVAFQGSSPPWRSR